MTTIHVRRQQQLLGFESLGVNLFDVVAAHWRLTHGGDPANEDDWERPDSHWRYFSRLTRAQMAPESKLMHGLSGRNTERTADDDEKAGAEIYIRPARGHNWSVVFADDVNAAGVRRVREWGVRCMVVETSPGSYHVWIMTDRTLTEHERLQVQRHLQRLLGSDRGSVSGEHLGRFAGFKNRKPWREPCFVNLVCQPDPNAVPLVITPEMLAETFEEQYKPDGRRRAATSDAKIPDDAAILATDAAGPKRSSGNGGSCNGRPERDTTNSGRVFGVVFRGLYYGDMTRDQAFDWIMADAETRKREGANLRHFADKTVKSARREIATGEKPYKRGR